MCLQTVSIVFLIFTFTGSLCLRMTRVVIPSPVQVGSRTMLSCFFELDWGENVYAVNWYRDGKEFFRYSPGERPPIQTFNRPGIFVDALYSNITTVSLKSVSLNTAGKYRCEIATEAPTYFTIHGQRDITVVDLPKGGPLITGIRERYRIGDLVDLNCSSAESKPAAALTWYINDHLADGSLVRDYPIEIHLDGLERSHIGLRFRLEDSHLRSDLQLRIKCTAEIASLYWRTHEQQVLGHLPRRQTITDDSSSSSRSVVSWRLSCLLLTCMRVLQQSLCNR